MRNLLLFFCCVMLAGTLSAQGDTLRVLFLGNSYTYQNNLPNLLAQLAAADGNTVLIDNNTPGGHTLDQHSQNPQSLAKIRAGNWDVVILQEQSQIPTIDYYRDNFMYPGARRLEDSIRAYNPCARTLLYMTWGRRFGGQQCDNNQNHCSVNFSDFDHMTDSLNASYSRLGDQLSCVVVPVGMAWKNAMAADSMLVLHTSDNSHPNVNGSYLAACTFFNAVMERSVSGNTFISSLSPALAAELQAVADSTWSRGADDWNQLAYNPQSSFVSFINGDSAYFTNTSAGPAGTVYSWQFGDGGSSTQADVTYQYQNPGAYEVTLVADWCGRPDTSRDSIVILPVVQRIDPVEDQIFTYPNPGHGDLLAFRSKNGFTWNSTIYTIEGKPIWEVKEWSNEIRIDVSEVPAGVYFIRHQSLNQSIVSRWIKID